MLWDMAVRHTAKRRNIIVLLAVVLTTVLFSTIFVVGTGVYNSFQLYTFLQTNNTAHGMVMYIDDDKYEKLQAVAETEQLGYEQIVATDILFDGQALCSTLMTYKDEMAAKCTFCYPEKGTLPKEENEIAASKELLHSLGVKAEVGEHFELTYELGGQIYEKEFILAGYWNENALAEIDTFLVSEAFVNRLNIKCTYNENADMSGVVHTYIMFDEDKHIKEDMEALLERCGLQEEYYNTNWAYLSNALDINMTTVFCFLFLVFIIGMTGYLLISNIYQITVANDIRYYGLLKLIGCTCKQIRYMMLIESVIVVLAGTIVGNGCGILVGNKILPMVLNMANVNGIEVEMNYVVLLFSSLFVLITVWLSMLKPYLSICRLSPVQALRY